MIVVAAPAPSTINKLVAYRAQMNSGSLNHVMPGARILCTVTMKFRPVRIELNPVMNTPIAIAVTCEFA